MLQHNLHKSHARLHIEVQHKMVAGICGLRWTWLAIPRWNGNTNDQHADNWAADAVPDNTHAADGSNTWAQAAHTIDQAIDGTGCHDGFLLV